VHLRVGPCKLFYLRRNKQVALLSQRGRAILRVCQYSFNSRPTIYTSSASSASDLQLRTIKFCSVPFSSLWLVVVHVVCDKHRFTDEWRARCGKLYCPPSRLFALHLSSTDSQKASYLSKIAICAYPTCIRRPG